MPKKIIFLLLFTFSITVVNADFWNNADKIIWVMGDVHGANTTHTGGMEQYLMRNASMKNVNDLSFQADAVLFTGDITNNGDAYGYHADEIKKAFITHVDWYEALDNDNKILYTPGNHDYKEYTAMAKFMDYYAPCNVTKLMNVTIGNLFFFGLCHEQERDPGDDFAYYGEALDDLDLVLNYLNDMPVNTFIFQHYKYNTWVQVTTYGDTNNYTKFTEIFRAYNKTLVADFFAHEHPSLDNHNTIYYNNTLGIYFIMNPMFGGNGAFGTPTQFSDMRFFSVEDGNETLVSHNFLGCDDANFDEICDNSGVWYNIDHLALKYPYDDDFSLIQPTQTPNPLTDLVNISQSYDWVVLDSNTSCHEKCLLYQDGVNVVNFTSFPYNRTGLINNTGYLFNFTIFNSSFDIKESNFSNTINIVTWQNPGNSPTQPETPQNLVNVSQGNISIYLSWNASIGSQKYLLYNYTTNLWNTTNILYNITGLTPGSTYNFSVKGYNSTMDIVLSNLSNYIITTTKIHGSQGIETSTSTGGGGGGGVIYTNEDQQEDILTQSFKLTDIDTKTLQLITMIVVILTAAFVFTNLMK